MREPAGAPLYPLRTISAGRRNCIGANFALLEAKIILAMMLREFDFQLSPNYVHQPKYVVTFRPGKGVPVRLRPLELERQ